jgi:hypothetical protein
MKEKEYPIVAVLWEDHSAFTGQELPSSDDISEYIRPSLTLGLLYKETSKYIIVISHLERYDDREQGDWMVIYKSAILGRENYGKIKLRKIRKKGD